MATANITWTPCGPSSDGQYVYYGKTRIATGTPVSGTGWVLYTGAALSNTASSATVSGLDDNVEYTFYVYCHCPSAGNGPLSNQGPLIKYICPTISNISPTYNGLSYNISIPNSANNAGSWIQNVVVSVYDSSNLNVIATNTYTQPFSNNSGMFIGLNPATNYNIQISYTDNSTRVNVCSSTPFTTAAACVAPTVTLSNATSNTFDVVWTPSTGGNFDVLVNNSVVASGLSTSPYTVTGLNSATIYQVNVRKNCSTGGNAISTTQNISTTNAFINGTISMNSDTNAIGTTANGSLYLLFTFAQPTASPITLYFGYTHENACNSCTGGLCNWSNGYDIFTPVVGAQTCPSAPSGDISSGGHPNYPFVVNIPQGVTSYNSGTNIHTTDPSPTLPNNPWQNYGAGGSGARGFTDLYVKVNSPSGYSANFTISNGTNISNVNIHNV